MANEFIQDDGQLRVFIVPVDILDVPGLSSSEKLVYMVLRSYVNPTDPTAFPAYETIAKKASLTRRWVIKVVKSLEEKGLIRKETRLTVTKQRKIRNTSNTYTLITPKKTKPSELSSPTPVNSVHPPSELSSPYHNHLTKSVRNMIDCSDEIAASSESTFVSNEIVQTLQEHAGFMMIDNHRSMQAEPQYMALIYVMLVKQFANLLDSSIVSSACEFYKERVYDWTKCRMRITLDNPVAFFNSCYKDAVKAYKAETKPKQKL